jgi:hypothetical protein
MVWLILLSHSAGMSVGSNSLISQSFTLCEKSWEDGLPCISLLLMVCGLLLVLHSHLRMRRRVLIENASITH